MGFSRQESWSSLPFFLPGDLPDPGIESSSPALADGFFFFFFFWSLIHLGSPNFVPPSVELKMIRERNDKYFCSKSQGSTLIKDPDYRKGILCKQHNCLDPSKANRGLHHFWGLCVQGQHTKTIGCHGCPVGVSNKEYICGCCLLIVCTV